MSLDIGLVIVGKKCYGGDVEYFYFFRGFLCFFDFGFRDFRFLICYYKVVCIF